MTIEQAVTYVQNQLKGLSNEFEVTLEAPYSDHTMLGEWLLSQACRDTVLQYDNADYIWFNIAGYNIVDGSSDKYSIKYYMNYYSTKEQESEAKLFAEQLASQLNLTSLSPANAIKAIYDWIAKNCDYDRTLKEQTWYRPTGVTVNNIGRNGLWDVLINKKAVCQGLSRAVYYMVNKFVAPCRIIQGNEWYNQGLYYHCWNICEIDNLWYNLDCTSAVHQLDENPEEQFDYWLLKNASDFNNTIRTKFIPLPNYMRSEWVNAIEMSSASWTF